MIVALLLAGKGKNKIHDLHVPRKLVKILRGNLAAHPPLSSSAVSRAGLAPHTTTGGPCINV